MASKIWRQAATLILVSKTIINNIPKNKCNYKILLLKRSNSAKFMPGAHVFPGGITEKADANLEWLKLYQDFGYNENQLGIFLEKDKNSLSREISLRISAIRETFEESCVLICKHKLHPTISRWGSFLAGEEIKNWQNRVNQDASQFIRMCRDLECCPDIWALKKWSGWLTPTTNPKRFEAIFFLATLDCLPPTFGDNKEITAIDWFSPTDILKLNQELKVWLPPPQVYEIARLRNFESMDALNELSNPEDLNKPINQILWMPKEINTQDGAITLLPGDYMYPSDINMYEKSKKIEKFEENNEQLRSSNVSLNRIEHYGNEGSKIIIRNLNISQNNILPWTELQA